MTHHVDLGSITLAKGGHDGATEGPFCVMEWVSIFAGERDFGKQTDQPDCTSPVLSAFAIAFNDGVDDATRQKLVPFIPRLVGTSGDPDADSRRAWMATDWLVRRFTPAWLRKCGLVDEAAELEGLEALTSTDLAREAQPIIDGAARKARAAPWDAAWDAARAAAWAAAGAAARDAAWAAAGDAARDAAWAAAWDAARAAAWAAASKKKGYDAPYRAARKAADEVLAKAIGDTIAQLRDDALRLFDDMIEVRSAVPA